MGHRYPSRRNATLRTLGFYRIEPCPEAVPVPLDGNPWFVAADVLRCLGLYSLKGTHKYLKHLGNDEKSLLTHDQIGGSRRGSTAISESGLYKLIMRSDKKEARVFQDWRGSIKAATLGETSRQSQAAVLLRAFFAGHGGDILSRPSDMCAGARVNLSEIKPTELPLKTRRNPTVSPKVPIRPHPR